MKNKEIIVNCNNLNDKGARKVCTIIENALEKEGMDVYVKIRAIIPGEPQ